MKRSELKRHEERLRALEAELSRRGPHEVEPNRSGAEQSGDDQDEQPLNEMLQSIASSRNRNLIGVLAEVQRALLKLQEQPEGFGLCEECEDPLPPRRLELMPYARLCVECQAERDGPRGGPTRKRLTDFT